MYDVFERNLNPKIITERFNWLSKLEKNSMWFDFLNTNELMLFSGNCLLIKIINNKFLVSFKNGNHYIIEIDSNAIDLFLNKQLIKLTDKVMNVGEITMTLEDYNIPCSLYYNFLKKKENK